MLKPNVRSLSISSQESYSAVMIADLVADVPISIESEQSSTKPTKEETNLAYDGHLDGEAKRVPVGGTDLANSHITNGGGITRGVILNAVQFGQPDSKTKSDEKAMQLPAMLPVPPLPQQISEPKGFKDMSILRKIAFGFSFLPSVLFVLCFAIILPCNVPKPCIEELWITTFNNTEAISRLEVSENVLFTASVQHQSVLIQLNKNNGYEKKAIKLDSRATYLKCGKIMNADKTDCIIMDEEGKFYTLNDSHSDLLWNPISDGEQPSPPVILPDCDGDKTEEIAMAVSSTKIKIMYGGRTVSTLTFSLCDSIPTKLMPWTTNSSSSDLVFVCTKDNKDILVKIPQNMWCAHTKNPQNEAFILYTGSIYSLNNGIVQSLENAGFLLWSGDEVLMIQANGSQLWQTTNVSHSEENRYVLYGNFRGDGKQVALLSSSASSGLKVTLLDSTNGNLLESDNFNDSEAVDVVTVRGENKDFILILRKVIKTRDIVTAALSQINDFSTTIASFISNDDIISTGKQLTSEVLSFLDLEGKLKVVKEMKDLHDASNRSTMKAVYEEDTDILHIYILSTSDDNGTIKTTKVRNINIANWNESKKSKCLGTVMQN